MLLLEIEKKAEQKKLDSMIFSKKKKWWYGNCRINGEIIESNQKTAINLKYFALIWILTY